MNISGPAAVAKPEMLFYAPGDLTVTSIRRPRPSVRKQLTDSKQAASPKKAAARTKKKELEV